MYDSEQLFTIYDRSREERDVCLLQGTVGDCPARILVDSGSTHDYVSTDFARKASLVTETREDNHWVQVADGTRIQAKSTVSSPLRIGRYKTWLKARTLPVSSFDIILGLDWLRSANPIIDWEEMTMKVQDDMGESHNLTPQDTTPYVRTYDPSCEGQHASPVPWKKACKMLRNPNSEGCLFTVRDTEQEVESTHIGINQPLNRNSGISDIQIGDKTILPLVTNFNDIFREELPAGLPPSRGYEHKIETGDALPINMNAYPLSPVHIEEQRRQISQMLAQGIIQESSSPWGFPVLFVKKPGGKWRMCVDFRALNAVTKKNGYPLPRIQECCDLIGRAKYLSKIDLTQGYYQIRVDKADREKTAFNTREGKYEYLAMPFGLANAPATFQSLMNRILRGPIQGKYTVVYLDDIVIFSNSLEEHEQHLTEVFKILRENKLYARGSKSLLAMRELEFCGHTLGNGKIRPLQSKVKMILDWPVPTNVHEVRQFLGLTTYYRRFIRRFAQICVPLHDLLRETDSEQRKRKFRKIAWTAQCQVAFNELKRILTTGPVLVQPDTNRPFFIECDSSEWAIGYVLLQADPTNGKLHPVAYDGRKLSPAEINYPIHEKELLAIKCALQAWRVYIDNGTTTIVYTDHESLRYMSTMKKPSKRLARWIDEFGEYDLDLRYRKGSLQVVPDALSRRPDLLGEGPCNQAQLLVITDDQEDEWAEEMKQYLLTHEPPPEWCRHSIYEEAQHFTVGDELLRIEDDGIHSPYIPINRRVDLLDALHGDYGHLGYPNIQGIVRGRGWWKSLVRDLKKFVAYCPQCQVAQRSKPGLERELPFTLTSDSMQIFDRWAIDLIGPLTKTPNGNQWIVTAIDYLTGWPVAKALPDAKAETIAKFVHDEITMVYGAPKELLSDNGSNLTGKIMDAYLRLLRTRHRVTTPYHPRTNGKVENFNGFLGTTLTKLCANQPVVLWDQYLSQALFAIRIRVHATSGHSPYFLLYGRNPRLHGDENPLRPVAKGDDGWGEMLGRLEKLQHARMIANRKLVERAIKAGQLRNDKVIVDKFEKGDYVLVRAETRNKFEGRWYGPYQIEKVLTLGTYCLRDVEGNIVKNLVNGARLVPANVDDQTRKIWWNSSKIQAQLRRPQDRSAKEIEVLFDTLQEDTPTYDELAAVPEREWKNLQRERVLGKVGEGIAPLQPHPLVTEPNEPQRAVPEETSQPPLTAGGPEPLREPYEIDTNRKSPQPQETREVEMHEDKSSHEQPSSQIIEMDLDPAQVQSVPDEVESFMPDDDVMEDVTREQDQIQTKDKMKEKKLSTWEREQAIAFGENQRVTTKYDLRIRPAKRKY